MTASAMTVSNVAQGSEVGAKWYSGQGALAANAEDGAYFPLGASNVQHISVTHLSQTPVQSGLSAYYDSSTGRVYIYGAAASNLLDAATVMFKVWYTD